MKKLRSRLVMMTMVAMLAIIGFSNSGDTLAGNTADATWSFSLSVSNSNIQKITKREKTDTTKIYLQWSSTYGGNLSAIYVSPYGANSLSGGSSPAGTSGGGEVFYRVPSTGQYSLTNYVKELGYGYATVGMKGAAGSGTAKGNWSPDSRYNYTILY
ncbi:MAG: hypothetical protein E7258_02010 [Lachnospiraceae bacterium]|nr:hypothetical protein [Lachnospiraceae bacterium]